ncbi:hypothetical protein ACIQKE_25140 [Streptomyces griseoviridis]
MTMTMTMTMAVTVIPVPTLVRLPALVLVPVRLLIPVPVPSVCPVSAHPVPASPVSGCGSGGRRGSVRAGDVPTPRPSGAVPRPAAPPTPSRR